MKLIFIYGPPAVGKLTVANKLSKLTGIPLFHNHHSRDIVIDIYGDKINDHYELVDKIRTDVLAHCAANGTDLIFTFVYEGEDDARIVRSYIESVESNRGDVIFVELTASRTDLLKRVSNESRKRFKKLSDPLILSKLTESMDIYTIPFVESLTINTTELDPDESSLLIANKLGLKLLR